MMLYIGTKFDENILNGIKVIERKNVKGHNSVRNVGGVTVPVLCTSARLMMVHICRKFHENILDGIKVIERTRCSYQKFRRALVP